MKGCMWMSWVTFVTPPAPCPPTQLTVASSCESNNISVSWQASQGSASYMVIAMDAEGHRWSCNTTSTSCQISNLLCGQQYQVYAVGVDEKCIGSKSNIEIFHTGIFVAIVLSNLTQAAIFSPVSHMLVFSNHSLQRLVCHRTYKTTWTVCLVSSILPGSQRVTLFTSTPPWWAAKVTQAVARPIRITA